MANKSPAGSGSIYSCNCLWSFLPLWLHVIIGLVQFSDSLRLGPSLPILSRNLDASLFSELNLTRLLPL